MNIFNTYNHPGIHSLGESAYSLYSSHQNAYGLTAKRYHMVNMTTFLIGALDVLSRIHAAYPYAAPLRGELRPCKSAILPICLKRVYNMDGVYSGFAGAKTCLLRIPG